MRSPEEVTRLLRRQWQRCSGGWLGGAGNWPLRIGLAPPGERAAAEQWPAFEAWRAAWEGAREPTVTWAERRWPRLGRQAVPEAVTIENAAALAGMLGESPRWQRAEARFAAWVGRWPRLAGDLRRQYDVLAEADDVEFERMGDMLAWLVAHPASHLFARQLPVAGLDSKWLEAHTGLLGGWLRTLCGLQRDVDFWQASGLRREAERLRLRLLDPALRAQVGGLGDIQAPFVELAGLPIAPRHVCIVENKQTGLAFEELPGAVVLMGLGYAVDRIAELRWLQNAAVHYWGDIDTHGLAILGRLRGHLPRVASLMMEEATLLAHRSLWVNEPRPHAAERIDHLTDVEQALYRDLRADRWGVRVRLEQERIGWNTAWATIVAHCGTAAAA